MGLQNKLCVFLSAAVLLCSAAPARAVWFEDKLTLGDGGYLANRVAFYGITEPNSILGADFTVTKAPQFADTIYTVRMPWYVTLPSGLNFMRVFFSPPTRLVDTASMGITNRRIINLYGKNGDDFSAAAAVGVSVAMQDMPYGAQRLTLPEFCYTLDYVQDYYGEFNFMASGAVFQYATAVGGSRDMSGAALDQNELADLGLLGGLYSLPKWSAGFQFTRVDKENNDAAVYINYHYVPFMTDGVPAAHSLGTAIRMSITETAFFNFDYNWVAQGSYSSRNFYRITLKAGF